MINIFCRHFPPPFEGGAQYFYMNLFSRIDTNFRLYTNKDAIQLRNFKVDQKNLNFIPKSRQPSSGIKLYWSALVLFFYLFRNRKTLKKEGIHCTTIWPYGLTIYLLSRLSNIKYTLFILGEEISTVLYGNGLKIQIIKFFYERIIMRASHIFSYSTFVTENTKKVVDNKAISISQLSVGLDPIKYCSSDYIIDSRLEKKSNKLVLFTICRHIPRKGVDTLIDSLNIVVKSSRNWHLYIAGNGPQTKELKQKVKQYKLDDKITFLGIISEEILHGFYRSADIFIMPNRIMENGDADGSPIVFVQASAYGIPCIGGDVVGTRDTIIDGETGFVVDHKNLKDLSEKILILINDEKLRIKMGFNSKKFILANFKWEDRLQEFYKINSMISSCVC